MSKLKGWTLALVVCAMAAATVAGADSQAGLGMGSDFTGIRKEMKVSIDDAGGKLIELAEAMPAAKYNWRPSKDVRSAAEVYLHVISANYGLPMFMGAAPAANSPVTKDNFGTFEKSTTDKAKIVGMLKDSFAYTDKLIKETPDSELDAAVNLFGNPTTKRGALFLLVNHTHEHLGQSIAYARSNNVTPPWTAREQAEAAKKKAADAGAKKAEGGTK